MNRFAYLCADAGIPVPGGKGASIHVASVVSEFRRRGLDGVVYARRANGDAVASTEVKALPKTVLSRARAHPASDDAEHRELELLAANLDLELESPVDFVYERYSLWHYAGLIQARRLGVPFVLEINAPLPDEAGQYRSLHHPRAASGVAELLCRNADGLVCVSDGVAEWAQALGATSDRTWVIPNGVNEQLFRPDGPSASLPFEGSPTVLLFVGSFRPWHGVDDLVSAFTALRNAGREIALLMVGDGPEKTRIEARVEEAGLASWVHFTGAVSPEEVASWSRVATMALAPYPALEDFYFSPLKLFEAMASGLPVVASAIGQIPGVIGDSRGVLYSPGQVDALERAICRLLDAPDEARSMGAAAREWVLEHATWQRRVGTILERVEALR